MIQINYMKILASLFSGLTIGYTLLNILMFLATGHSFDSIRIDYKFIMIASVVIFPLASLALMKTFSPTTNWTVYKNLSLIMLGLTVIICGWYFYAFVASEYSDLEDLSLNHFIPLIILGLTFVLLVGVNRKKDNKQ